MRSFATLCISALLPLAGAVAIAAEPTVVTGFAYNVTNTGATLTATVNPQGLETASIVFEYGQTLALNQTAQATPQSLGGRDPVEVSATLTNLEPLRRYSFRIRAENADGSAVGSRVSFTPGATPPLVTTNGAVASTTTANLTGTINPRGTPAEASFEYSLNGTVLGTVSASRVSGDTPIEVKARLSGLLSNTRYDFRLFGVSEGGRVDGETLFFVTHPEPPTAITGSATDITATGATLHATVNPNGSPATASFVYRLVGSDLMLPVAGSVNCGSDRDPVPVVLPISGLDEFTEYEFAVSATYTDGTVLGEFQPFTTLVETLATQPDSFFVRVGEGELTLPVLANDSGTGLVLTEVVGPRGAAPSVNPDAPGISFVASASSGETETLTYRVMDAAGNVSAETSVTVRYIDAFRGTYFNGLTTGDGRTLRLRVDLDFDGFATGRLDWDDEQYPFKTSLPRDGRITIEKSRPGESARTLLARLLLNPNGPAGPVIQTSFDDLRPSSPATLAVDLQYFPPVPNNSPTAGLQVLFIDPGTSDGILPEGSGSTAEPPGGIGFTLVKVSRKAKARFVTVMPDFGTFSLSSQLIPGTDEASLPRYLFKRNYRADKRLGAVDGSAFAALAQAGFGVPDQFDRIFGTVDWTLASPLRRSDRRGAGGTLARLIAQLEGYPFRAGKNGVPFGFDSTKNPNATVRIARGGLDEPLENIPAYIRNGKLTIPGDNPDYADLGLSIRFNPTGGTFNGSFLMGMNRNSSLAADEKVKIKGGVAGDLAFILNNDTKQPRARGTFHVKSTRQTGRIEIVPR